MITIQKMCDNKQDDNIGQDVSHHLVQEPEMIVFQKSTLNTTEGVVLGSNSPERNTSYEYLIR